MYPQTEGIDEAEISKRKGTGECLLCAWPPDRKGNHQVKNCISRIKLHPGTALGLRALRIKSSEQESSDSLSGISNKD